MGTDAGRPASREHRANSETAHWQQIRAIDIGFLSRQQARERGNVRWDGAFDRMIPIEPVAIWEAGHARRVLNTVEAAARCLTEGWPVMDREILQGCLPLRAAPQPALVATTKAIFSPSQLSDFGASLLLQAVLSFKAFSYHGAPCRYDFGGFAGNRADKYILNGGSLGVRDRERIQTIFQRVYQGL